MGRAPVPGLAGGRAGTGRHLYVDGHVRLYHGSQTALPKRYVSRQRLCLRGTTDYWVNDALGQPFFAVERPIDHGLLEALRSDIVPRLLKDVPGQPTAAELKADRYRARFVILFDREGYSPEFFKEMWQTHRIACITYHKYPKDDWPAAEFAEIETTLPGGERVALQLAERGTWIGDKKSGLWVREVRKLTPSGHQVSLISTAYGELALQDAAQLFSRWSQENFLRYMMQHYAIDLLRRCAKITSATWMMTMGPNGVVPIRQERARLEPGPSLVCRPHLPPCGVLLRIQDRPAMESCGRPRPAYVLEHFLVADQWLSGPVAADQAEHPVVDRVPLARSGWVVGHRYHQVKLVRQLLQGDFPFPLAVVVSPASVCLDQQRCPCITLAPRMSHQRRIHATANVGVSCDVPTTTSPALYAGS